MWYQFFLENLHFGLNIIAALVFFAVFWLYFDAWLEKKTLKDTLRVVGYFLLSLSFIVSAIQVESGIVSLSIVPANLYFALLFATRFFGYIFLIAGLLLDPLQKKPNERILHDGILIPLGISLPFFAFTTFSYPVLAALCGFLYLRRATIGLENHLKHVSLAFFILAFAELLSLGLFLQNTDNPALFALVAPFGMVSLLQRIALFASIFVLRQWVFGYLLKRFQSQLFIILTTSVVTVFIIITVAFTALLLKNLENDAISHLQTDVNILQYSIDSKKAETLSDAQVASQNQEIIKAVDSSDKKTLATLTTSILLTKKETTLIILSKDGVVLARGDDPQKIGDSLSDDTLVKKALSGESVSTVVTKDGVVVPTVSIRSAAPIKSSDVIGAVIIGTDIDNAFVDGVKNATGLDTSVYGDNIRSATTFVSNDGKSRLIGIKEETSQVKNRVLGGGKAYVGSVNILNTPFIAAFAPIKDIDSVTVGMLFVGKEQSELLATAGHSIELTFLVTVILLVLSIFPAYLTSRYISRQLN